MRFNHLIAGLVFSLISLIGQASVVVNSTRFIYKSTDREISLVLSNEGEQPALIQAWIDNGDAKAAPSSVDVPFVITPALLRIEPKKNQTLRLIFTGADLPKNKESLYWLNILEIPPKPDAGAGENYLQFSIRSRLKLFYRPAGFGDEVAEAAKQLKVIPVKGKPMSMRLENPTPFHISLGNIQLLNKDQQLAKPMFGMVQPYEHLDLNFDAEPGKAVNAPAERIDFLVIDDLGATILRSLPLTNQALGE